MALHMVKLCVGANEINDLKVWQNSLLAHAERPYHRTRMVPKRASELLDGGSIYWVIRGLVQVRQTICEIKEMTDRTGRRACELIFDPQLIMVEPTPKRAFQGWRYLKACDAPVDLDSSHTSSALPMALRSELKQALVW